MISRKTNVKGLGIVVQSDGDLYTNVKNLNRGLISPRDDAYARIYSDIGRTEGTRVSMLVKYLKGEVPVLEIEPRIITSGLAKSLVEANYQNKYLCTGSERVYTEARKRADEQVKNGISPEGRTAMVCPLRTAFDMSPTEHSEDLTFIFKDMAQAYYDKNDGPIKFIPISPDVVDGSDLSVLTNPKGTIVDYVWFRSLADRSELDCDNQYAHSCTYGARGVLEKSAEGASPKISGVSSLDKKVASALKNKQAFEYRGVIYVPVRGKNISLKQ